MAKIIYDALETPLDPRLQEGWTISTGRNSRSSSRSGSDEKKLVGLDKGEKSKTTLYQISDFGKKRKSPFVDEDFVARAGIEPATHGFSVHCSTD